MTPTMPLPKPGPLKPLMATTCSLLSRKVNPVKSNSTQVLQLRSLGGKGSRFLATTRGMHWHFYPLKTEIMDLNAKQLKLGNLF